MEQPQDRTGRQAFKITFFGCLGIIVCIFVVLIGMTFCTAMLSTGGGGGSGELQYQRTQKL